MIVSGGAALGTCKKSAARNSAVGHDDFTDKPESWPALPLDAWQDTRDTLHMWTQIVGKVRLALSPLINHWWEVPLYISARGLTTSAIPYQRGIFEVEFDFIDHNLVIQTSEDRARPFRWRRDRWLISTKSSWRRCCRSASR